MCTLKKMLIIILPSNGMDDGLEGFFLHLKLSIDAIMRENRINYRNWTKQSEFLEMFSRT